MKKNKPSWKIPSKKATSKAATIAVVLKMGKSCCRWGIIAISSLNAIFL